MYALFCGDVDNRVSDPSASYRGGVPDSPAVLNTGERKEKLIF